MKNKIFIGIVLVTIVSAVGFFISRQTDYKSEMKKEISKIEKSGNKDKAQKKTKENNSMNDDDYGNPNASVIYYYGKECPHCQKVSEFLSENDIYDKVDFAKKEVWHNKDNGAKLMEAAKKCGIDPSKVGVPFLYADGECYIGDSDVISYFRNKAGL